MYASPPHVCGTNIPPLQVDIWPFDLESGVRVSVTLRNALYKFKTYFLTFVPILVFLGLSVLELFSVRDRQTSDSIIA